MKILIVAGTYIDKKILTDRFKNIKSVDIVCIRNPEYAKSVGLIHYDKIFYYNVCDKVFEILAFRCDFFNKELRNLLFKMVKSVR